MFLFHVLGGPRSCLNEKKLPSSNSPYRHTFSQNLIVINMKWTQQKDTPNTYRHKNTLENVGSRNGCRRRSFGVGSEVVPGVGWKMFVEILTDIS